MKKSGAAPSSPKTPKPSAPPKGGSFRANPEPCPDHVAAFTSSKPEQIEASRRVSADFQRGLKEARETVLGSSPGGITMPGPPSSGGSFKGASSPKAGSPKAGDVWTSVFNPGRNYNMPKHAERFDIAANGSPTTWCVKRSPLGCVCWLEAFLCPNAAQGGSCADQCRPPRSRVVSYSAGTTSSRRRRRGRKAPARRRSETERSRARVRAVSSFFVL